MSARVIWRIRLRLQQRQEIALPPSSRILTVQRRDGVAGDQLDLWADVPRDEPDRVLYVVELVGTGDAPPPAASALTYLTTVQLASGQLVFHVFTTTAPSRRAAGGAP